ncbi:MAG: metallophosphoesterase family protein [Hyphomicrobiaceae bacterium]
MAGVERFTIAQFTDVHLSRMPSFPMRYWNLKRLLGFANWHRGRKNFHSSEIVARLVSDLKARPNAFSHIVVTGDLVNIGLPEEYDRARQWLEALGGPSDVTVIPGNHDIYVEMPEAESVGKWQDYMQPIPVTGQTLLPEFPFVRTFGKVALVCCNSAEPTPPFVAAGRLGDEQRARLRQRLVELRELGKVRIVLIHHPPLLGLASPSRGLKDAEALQAILEEVGAELVLYGHNHRNLLSEVQCRATGNAIPVVGLASSSAARAHNREDLACYNLFDVMIEGNRVKIEMRRRGLMSKRALAIGPEDRIEELAQCEFNLALTGQEASRSQDISA